jgi:hypothetical protein
MVLPYRPVGFADGAAPIPVYGWDLTKSLKSNYARRQADKVANRAKPGRPGSASDADVGQPVGRLRIHAGPMRVIGISHARDAASASEVDRHTRMAAFVPTVKRLKYSPDPSL